MDDYGNAIKIKGSLKTSKSGLSLRPIELDEDYAKEWNETKKDFVILFKDDEPISDTLYRVGGMGKPDFKKDKYFMLLKYVEGFYDKDILKLCKNKDPKHLKSVWCIIDSNGEEKVSFDDTISYPYIKGDSCVYSINRNYYNIETGEHYGAAYTYLESSTDIYLELKYNQDESKNGVLIINKQTGKSELKQ